MSLKFVAGFGYDVTCDTCHKTLTGFVTKRTELIKGKKGEGWKFYRPRKKDTTYAGCPECVEKSQAAKGEKQKAVMALRDTRKKAEEAYKEGLANLDGEATQVEEATNGGGE